MQRTIVMVVGLALVVSAGLGFLIGRSAGGGDSGPTAIAIDALPTATMPPASPAVISSPVASPTDEASPTSTSDAAEPPAPTATPVAPSAQEPTPLATPLSLTDLVLALMTPTAETTPETSSVRSTPTPEPPTPTPRRSACGTPA